MPLDPVAYRPYNDPDHFIREVTDRIWVDRDIEYIHENYEPDSIVHLGSGTATTRAEVIEGSTMLMAASAAPGLAVQPAQAADIVWEGRGDDAFLSSHLVFRAVDRHVGGIPRHIHLYTIANCLYRRGRMVEEWCARDSLATVLQSGLDPEAVARESTFRGFAGSFLEAPPEDVLAKGDSGPRSDDYRAECELVIEMIDEVWNKRNFARVSELVVRDLFLHSVGGRTYLRPAGYQSETLRLLAAFPNATFEVRDIQSNFNHDYAGLRIAVLWKMTSRYDGLAHYGPLTNSPVNLLGISHFLVQHGRIVSERRIYDEIALRAQINAARGDELYSNRNIYFF